MPWLTRRGWVVLAVCGIGAALSAQQTPTFRAHADLVQIPVTVLDRDGHFVSGLTKDDFQLQVDGKPVAVMNVDLMQSPPPPPPPAPAPAGVYSNQSAWLPAPRLVLLLDYEHTPIQYLPYLRGQLKKWFQHSLPPGEQVAVFALDGGLEVLQPFTTDRDALLATLDHMVAFHSKSDPYASVQRELQLLDGFGGDINDPLVTGATDGASASDASTSTAPDSVSALQSMQEMMQRGQYFDTMHGLEELAEILEGVPGRKSVIWLTTQTSLKDAWNPKLALSMDVRDQAFGHLNQANVALFPLDVTGLETLMPIADASSGSFNSRRPALGHMKAVMAKGLEHSAMGWAADRTGGEAYGNTNGFGDVLTQVIHASAEAYVLSFTPPVPLKDHPYREVKVRVERQKKVNLLYRHQYLQPDITLADQQNNDFLGQVRRLALQPMEMGGIPIAVRTAPLGPMETVPVKTKAGQKPGPQLRALAFALVMPYTSVLHSDVDANRGAGFDFSCIRILMPLDNPAHILAFAPNRFQKQLTDAQAQQLASRAVLYRSRFDVPPGHLYLARLIVRDNLTGQTGTVSFRVDAR